MWLYEAILNFEIYQILWCQNVLQPVEKLLTFFSVFTKSANIYVYVLPLLYLHSPEFYVRTLLTSISSNILLNLLKWILSEGRPYWYVFSMPNRPVLRQTELTCETSSGNPSGHVMFQAAFLYIVLTECMNYLWRKRILTKKVTKLMGWIIYLVLINLVAISRMYFACHFFHQCLIGAFLGHFMARYNNVQKIFNYNKKQMLGIGIGIAVVTTSIFFGQKLVGRDPLWSIKIAFNRCENPLYIKPESTPVFAFIRDFGLLSGVILSAPVSNKFINKLEWHIKCIITAIIMIGYHAAIQIIPHNRGVLTYYCSTFFVHLSCVFILLNYDSFWQIVNSKLTRNKIKTT